MVFLPNSPSTALTLTENEKKVVSHALLMDGIAEMGKDVTYYPWTELKRALKQPHVIILTIAGFFSGTFSFLNCPTFKLRRMLRCHSWVAVIVNTLIRGQSLVRSDILQLSSDHRR